MEVDVVDYDGNLPAEDLGRDVMNIVPAHTSLTISCTSIEAVTTRVVATSTLGELAKSWLDAMLSTLPFRVWIRCESFSSFDMSVVSMMGRVSRVQEYFVATQQFSRATFQMFMVSLTASRPSIELLLESSLSANFLI